MNKILQVSLLCFFLNAATGQIKIDRESGTLDQETIEKLKASGLDNQMIEQLAEQLKNSRYKPKTQDEINQFFENYSAHASEHYKIWFPINYDPKEEINEMEHAVSAFSRLFGAPRQEIQVVLFKDLKDAEYTAWEAFENKAVLPFKTADIDINLKEPFAKALAHEACHLFLNAYENGHSQIADGYGHGQTPDWFDEAVAISCEGEELKQRRINHFSNNKNKLSLKDFVTQAHPMMEGLSGALNKAKTETSSEEKNKGVRIFTLQGDFNNEDAEKSYLFYSMACAVGNWITENDPEAWVRLFKHYISGGATDLTTLKAKNLLNLSQDDLT